MPDDPNPQVVTGQSTIPNQGQQPTMGLDLTPVKIGTQTFSHPCFWMILGAVGAFAALYFLQKRK